jgi:hypothetical protein
MEEIADVMATVEKAGDLGRSLKGSKFSQEDKGSKEIVKKLKYLAKFFVLAKGGGSAIFDSAYQAAVGEMPITVTQKKAAELLDRAMWDTDLAKTLMMEANERNFRVINRRMRAHIVGTGANVSGEKR